MSPFSKRWLATASAISFTSCIGIALAVFDHTEEMSSGWIEYSTTTLGGDPVGNVACSGAKAAAQNGMWAEWQDMGQDCIDDNRNPGIGYIDYTYNPQASSTPDESHHIYFPSSVGDIPEVEQTACRHVDNGGGSWTAYIWGRARRNCSAPPVGLLTGSGYSYHTNPVTACTNAMAIAKLDVIEDANNICFATYEKAGHVHTIEYQDPAGTGKVTWYEGDPAPDPVISGNPYDPETTCSCYYNMLGMNWLCNAKTQVGGSTAGVILCI